MIQCVLLALQSFNKGKTFAICIAAAPIEKVLVIPLMECLANLPFCLSTATLQDAATAPILPRNAHATLLDAATAPILPL